MDRNPLRLEHCLTASNIPNSVINATDGFTDTLLFVSGRYVMSYCPRTKKQTVFLEHGAEVAAVAFNPAANIGASADRHPNHPSVSLWDMASGEALLEIDLRRSLCSIDFSNEGQILAAVEFPEDSKDQRVLVWDLMNGVESEPAFIGVVPPGDPQTCIRINPSDATQLISNGDKSVYFWQYDPDCRDSMTPQSPQNDFQNLDPSLPSGSKDAVTATRHGDLILWKQESCEEPASDGVTYAATKSLNVHHGAITFLTTRGDLLVVAGSHGTASFLDADLKLDSWMDGFGTGSIHALSFSQFPTGTASIQNSEFIVGTDRGDIYASSLESENSESRLILKPAWLQGVVSLNLHPRKAHLAWISDEGIVEIFDIQRLEALDRKRIKEKEQPTCLSYFRDGSHLAIGFGNGALVIVTEELELVEELQHTKAEIRHTHVNASGLFLSALTVKDDALLFKNDQPQRKAWNFKGRAQGIQNCHFDDDLEGKSRLFGLDTNGDLVEIDIHDLKPETGSLAIKRLFLSTVAGIAFSMGPPKRYFEKLSAETDLIVSDIEGKLHVRNLDANQHVCTYLPVLRDGAASQFGFFQSADVGSGSVMWSVSSASAGLMEWPPTTPFAFASAQRATAGEIQSAHVCYDGKRMVVNSVSGEVLLWSINFDALHDPDAQPPVPSDDLTDAQQIQLRQIFEALHKTDPDHDGISESQLEVACCSLGYFPSAIELANMISELKTLESRLHGRDWSGWISFDTLQSLFVRYSRRESVQKIQERFSALTGGDEEIFTHDLLQKLEHGTQTIQHEVQAFMEKAIKQKCPTENTLYQKEVLNAESLVEWLQP